MKYIFNLLIINIINIIIKKYLSFKYILSKYLFVGCVKVCICGTCHVPEGIHVVFKCISSQLINYFLIAIAVRDHKFRFFDSRIHSRCSVFLFTHYTGIVCIVLLNTWS